MAARSSPGTRPNKWQQHEISDHSEVQPDSISQVLKEQQPPSTATNLNKHTSLSVPRPKMFAPSTEQLAMNLSFINTGFIDVSSRARGFAMNHLALPQISCCTKAAGSPTCGSYAPTHCCAFTPEPGLEPRRNLTIQMVGGTGCQNSESGDSAD